MLQASDSTVWMGAGFLLAAGLAAVLAAIGQLPLARRTHCRPYWHAGALAAALAGPLAAGVGASSGVVTAGLAGAALGAWLVRRRDLTRRPRLVALLGCSAGFAAMAGGFARYVTSAETSVPSSSALANVERVELYAAIFIGALIFATSAIVFCKLAGLLETKDAGAPSRPGHNLVNLLALLLCGWLGYGFVTEQAQPFGLASLLAMSALAAALGAHLMLSREYSNGHGADAPHVAHVFAGRCHGLVLARRGLLARIEWHGGDEQMWTLRETSRGMVRTGAYRHGRSWRNGSHQHGYPRTCARYRSTQRVTRGQA